MSGFLKPIMNEYNSGGAKKQGNFRLFLQKIGEVSVWLIK
jgi:hypothetical protein